MVKKTIKLLLNRLGYEIIRKDPLNPGWNHLFISQLSKPRTVLDVGACCGTFSLYRAFPNAQFFLIEPVIENQPALEKIAKLQL